jgi:S-DNA-T family DNA segregation ATPase FtsK/SpoIIIE
MATAAARQRKDLDPDWRDRLRESFRRLVLRSGGAALLAIAVAIVTALASHNSTDPSFSTAAAGPAGNWLGSFGAYTSDLLLLLFGLGSILFAPVVGVAGLRLLRVEPIGRMGRSVVVAGHAAILLVISLSLTNASAVSGLPGGWGGAPALALGNAIASGLDLIPDARFIAPSRVALLLLFGIAGLSLAYFALALNEDERIWLGTIFKRSPAPRSIRPRHGREERETVQSASPPKPRPTVAVKEPTPAAPARPSARTAANQRTLALGDNYVLPDLGLLAPAQDKGKAQIDRAALERNARVLESVLEDFHVRGDIVEVRPGPVVTMYELEPASGIKASRVIQLADDIARNMQAISARVAIIPGRSVI